MECQGMTGICYRIESKSIAGGGEGSIHQIVGNDSQVAKIFKEGKRDSEREKKLQLMVQTKLLTEQLKYITWPLDVIYENHEFVGYIMPKVLKAESLTALYNTDKYDLRFRLMVAINLCIAIETVHDMGQVCGDLNPQNICVNLNINDRLNGFRVTLVDTDSYHFVTPIKTYRCEVGLADYLAPEIQNKVSNGLTLKNAPLPTYTQETDLFALAVHIFCLLMNGCHPFACAKDNNGTIYNTMEQMISGSDKDSVVAPQPIENIKGGFFPFYEKKDNITTPIYAPDFDSLPKTVQQLFIRTFVDGYSKPEQRVKPAEWIETLKPLISDIKMCSNSHYYFQHVSECPLCVVNHRMVNMFGNKQMIPPADNTITNSINIEQNGNHTLSNNKVYSRSKWEIDVDVGKWEINFDVGRFVKWMLFLIFILLILLVGYIYYEMTDEQLRQEKLVSVEQTDIYGEIESQIEEQQKIEEQWKIEEQKEIEEQQKKIDDECLKYGKKIQKYMKNKEYKKAVKLMEKPKECFDEKKKIYILDGKLVDTIKSGKGFVFYCDAQYAYMGQFKNGKPSGKGTEVGYPEETGYSGYYTIKGKFKKGYPNGYCTVYYSNKYEEQAATYKGNYKNGWENGSFTWIDEMLDGSHSDTYYFTSVMGNRKVIETDDEGNYVYAQSESGWIYFARYKEALKGYHTEHYKEK